jgi:hypothetical protein
LIVKTATISDSDKVIAIDSVKTINFAGNLEGYRSPQKAMLFSFLVPGVGQGYAKRHWKIALFGVLEATFIGVSAKMAYEGKQQREKALDYASRNYKKDKFVNFYKDYQTFVTKEFLTNPNLNSNPDPAVADSLMKIEVVQNIFGGNDIDYYQKDLSEDEMKIMYSDNSTIYGWTDADIVGPGFSADHGYVIANTTAFKVYHSDTTWFVNHVGVTAKTMGYSKLQLTYEDMQKESKQYYDVSKNFMYLLLLNHIASAVDAFFTAKAYNDKLLEKESVWRHIGIDQRLAYSREGGVESFVGFKVKF